MAPKRITDFIEFNDDHLTKKIIYGDPDMLSFILNLKVGQKLPRHGHEKGTLSLHVLQGGGTIAINDIKEPLTEGQLFYLSGSDMLEVPEVTRDLSLLVTMAPNPSNPVYRQPK